MDKQILEGILKQIQPLVKANEPHYFSWFDYKVLALIIPFISALIVVYIAHRLSRRPKKTNLVIKGASAYQQDTCYMGRLIIKNESNVRAVNVEAYVESVINNGNKINNYLPIPLRWTHSDLNKSKSMVLRDVSGNQSVFLDIYYYGPYPHPNESIKLVIFSTLYEIKYCDIKPGITDLYINLYQESGQVVPAKVTISWEEGKLPEFV